MRIVNREEFLKLPEGTVYSLYEPLDQFIGLFIKGETWTNDWIYQDCLESVESESSDEFIRIMVDALENGTEFRNDLNSCERDGLFNKNQRFVVYDEEDSLRLIKALQSTVKHD